MKVIILGGFLGSGKTSVLLQLAETIADSYGSTHKVPLVIIENEIGEVSVDSKALGGFEVRELFSGCVCCTLAGDLTENVKKIYVEYAPAYIIIEATGLAYPDKIVETIRQYVPECDSVATITIADASRWYEEMEYVDVLLTGQMKSGDMMLLNKIDLVSEQEKENIVADLKALKPEAEVFAVSTKNGLGEVAHRLMEV